MPGERLVSVWEAAYAIDRNPGLQLKQEELREITLSFSHLPGVCVHLSTKKFDELFPEKVVDFQAYKNFVTFRLLEKGTALLTLEEEVEKVCWEKCRPSYEENKWRVPSRYLFYLWQMFIRLADEDTYPPTMDQSQVEWLVEKLATSIGRGWRQPDVRKGATFKKVMETLESGVFEGHTVGEVKKAIDELYNWLVLEICQAGWLTKRTRKQANWTNWVKRWFVLTPGKLTYYDSPAMKTFKGDVSVTSHSVIESMPNYKGLTRTLKNRFRINNHPYLEVELCAPDETERAFWMGALQEVADASNLNLTPVQALLQARHKQRKESLQETDRKIQKFQKTARRVQRAVEDEEKEIVKKPTPVKMRNATPIPKAPVKVGGSSQKPEAEEEFDNNMYAYQKDKIRQVFLKIDTNGNGKIDLGEFSSFIDSLGLSMDEAEIKLLFTSLDVDKNGALCLGEFEDYFLRFIMDETGNNELETKLRTAFLKADRNGTGTVDFKEFTEFAWDKRRSIRVSQLLNYFGKMDEGKGEVSFDQFRTFFHNQNSLMDVVIEEEEEEGSNGESDATLEQKLKSMYLGADVAELGDFLRKRWDAFASFRRVGASGSVVMKGAHGMVADVVPGDYSLIDLACFNDLPPITPKHIVIKNFKWVPGKAKSGKAIFPPDFDGRLPIEIATQEHLGYYGASLAEGNQIKVSLLYRHGIQDFTYQNKYLDDYVTNTDALGGAGIERHEFSHLDCPLDEDSGHFVMGKLEGDELHLSGFKVPTRHTLYIPGGTIHCNDYLKGTWRTMLSDEAEIDHVQLHRRKSPDSDAGLVKFHFTFVEKL